MIQTRTLLSAADNSGAKSLMCIKVLGGSKRRYASVGDIIKVSIKDAAPRARVKKGDVSIERGETGRRKTIRVAGASADAVRGAFR